MENKNTKMERLKHSFKIQQYPEEKSISDLQKWFENDMLILIHNFKENMFGI